MKKKATILSLAILPFFAFAQADKEYSNLQNNITMTTINKLEFPQLPYAYDGLEPFVDKLTVEIHYSKHHKAYFDNFINATKVQRWKI